MNREVFAEKTVSINPKCFRDKAKRWDALFDQLEESAMQARGSGAGENIRLKEASTG